MRAISSAPVEGDDQNGIEQQSVDDAGVNTALTRRPYPEALVHAILGVRARATLFSADGFPGSHGPRNTMPDQG